MEIVLLVAVAAFAGWYFFLRQKKVDITTETVSAPYKVETPEPTPVATPETVGKPADDIVEQAAPVTVVEETPKKKVAKPKAPKAETTKPKPATKPATKTTKVKRTK